MRRTILVHLLVQLSSALVAEAWIFPPPNAVRSALPRISITQPKATPLFAGGFGGSDSAANKEVKLKPKQQWDRYNALKKESSVKVAVKVGDDWLEVGLVKSQGGSMTEIAVARQRALLVEVGFLTYYREGCLDLGCVIKVSEF